MLLTIGGARKRNAAEQPVRDRVGEQHGGAQREHTDADIGRNVHPGVCRYADHLHVCDQWDADERVADTRHLDSWDSYRRLRDVRVAINR